MAFKRSRVRFPSAPPFPSLRSVNWRSLQGLGRSRRLRRRSAAIPLPLGYDSTPGRDSSLGQWAEPQGLGRSRRLRRRSAAIPFGSTVKDLKRLPVKQQRRVIERIEGMSEDLAGDVKRLTNFTPEYRLRVGSYRILFEIEEESAIVIYRVRHRRDAYRK